MSNSSRDSRKFFHEAHLDQDHIGDFLRVVRLFSLFSDKVINDTFIAADDFNDQLVSWHMTDKTTEDILKKIDIS
jgi:hypothetical protein